MIAQDRRLEPDGDRDTDGETCEQPTVVWAQDCSDRYEPGDEGHHSAPRELAEELAHCRIADDVGEYSDSPDSLEPVARLPNHVSATNASHVV